MVGAAEVGDFVAVVVFKYLLYILLCADFCGAYFLVLVLDDQVFYMLTKYL